MKPQIIPAIRILFIASVLFIGCSKDDGAFAPNLTENPVANFTYSGTNTPAPAVITFTNTSTNATKYSWDFGDNGTSTLENPQHTYAVGGVYTVILAVEGAAGSTAISKTITIQSAPTTCKITTIKLTGMPFVDANGAGWDDSDGPDVYFTINDYQSGNILVNTGSYYDNITPGNLPLPWTLATPFSISPITTIRSINIWDYDPLNSDDYIGGVGFNPSAYATAGYPSFVNLSYQGLNITLTLQWQ